MGSRSDRITELEAELARGRTGRDASASSPAHAAIPSVAIQNAPVGVMRTSMTSGKYVFFNAAHGALLGATPEDITSVES